MFISEDIKYVGVNDHELDLFEGLYEVPNGMAYNSYIIMDEKIAVMDSVDRGFTNQWLDNVDRALGGKNPDYLVVHHMEPDHSASIMSFMERYPEAKMVSSNIAFIMMKNNFGTDLPDRRVIVNEGDTLSLGKHNLSFIKAPMVHWPEVMMSYDSCDKVLFSADAFGKFGALDVEEEWEAGARRYYFGIVGKFGSQVQSLLKKLHAFDIGTICALHGPVLKGDTKHYIDLYDIWSSYRPEKEGVVIAYTSVYGGTRKAVMKLAELLKEKGCPEVVIHDLARCDTAEAVSDAFRYSKLVMATTTYSAGIFPFMREFIDHLTERNFCNREIGMIENGTWMPVAAQLMRQKLEKSKDLRFTENNVRILASLSEENYTQLEALAEEMCRDY